MNASSVTDEVLSRAAQSTDPNVRSLVVRRMELAAEITKIDLFFTSWHQLTVADAAGHGSGPLPRLANGVMSRRQFADVVKNILLAAGRPLKPSQIYGQFKALYPDSRIASAEAMRKRLSVNKEAFRHIEDGTHFQGGAGYWPVDYPLPNAPVVRNGK